MMVVKAPIATDNAVMIANASNAPAKMVSRAYFIAMMAAMKNVLSPNSDTKITDNDDRKP